MTQSMTAAIGNELEVKRLMRIAEEIGMPDSYSGKRATPRVKNGLRLELTTDLSQTGDVRTISMHDLSESGLAFWSKQRLERSATVYLREFSGDQPRPWLQAHVTHCTNGIRGFLIGAEFHLPAPQAAPSPARGSRARPRTRMSPTRHRPAYPPRSLTQHSVLARSPARRPVLTVAPQPRSRLYAGG